ncbi:MAG: hypothetical protein KME52_09810 [Desmonostoc geniculatum HA4340-LM1]|nr:hypothetical protein [Desmonostoc geniculatum HA4340-LM1]
MRHVLDSLCSVSAISRLAGEGEGDEGEVAAIFSLLKISVVQVLLMIVEKILLMRDRQFCCDNFGIAD